MPLKDQIKNYARKLTEDPPNRLALSGMIRKRMPITKIFADDGIVPPRLPMLLYRNAVRFDKDYDPATVVDALFAANGWGRSWRDSIYDFVHYHSQIHEVLGVARGNAIVECGGIKGRRLKLRTGDVVILPAGTGHRLIESSKNFLVVGAYPSEGTYDECTDTRDRTKTIKTISKVRKPKSDPVYGRLGPLIKEWRR